jgi:hypothetical protein
MEPSNISDLLGYAAAGLVLVAFSLRSITALRSAAIASNVMFIAYAATAHLMPVLILHALLLPLNFWRLRQDLTSNPGAREPLLKQRSRDDRVAERGRRRPVARSSHRYPRSCRKSAASRRARCERDQSLGSRASMRSPPRPAHLAATNPSVPGRTSRTSYVLLRRGTRELAKSMS